MYRAISFAVAAALLPALPVTAADIEAGGAAFNKQCATCHVVVDPSGETLAGRRARTGPNLYGVVGHAAAQVEGYRYGSGITDAAAKGLVWSEDNFVAYVQDTNGFLREFTGDSSARSKMAWKVRKEEEAHDIYAFLQSLNPPE